MQILILEIFWCRFHKQPLKLQINLYFQQTWYIRLIMLG